MDDTIGRSRCAEQPDRSVILSRLARAPYSCPGVEPDRDLPAIDRRSA
jgi:hypothetical protein